MNSALVVTATDMIARAVQITKGMEYNDGENAIKKIATIPAKEKVFHTKGEVLCFTWEGNTFAVPYHNENYLEILKDLGYVEDESLEVPFSSKNSFPVKEKMKWKAYMSLSRYDFKWPKKTA